MSDSPIPKDQFSLELRKATDAAACDAALRATSTVQTSDIYGNTEAWVLDTFRLANGREVLFVQQIGADGGKRLMFQDDVTRILARHRDQLSAAAKRRQGRNLIALRKQRGDQLGNPEALRKARRARKASR